VEPKPEPQEGTYIPPRDPRKKGPEPIGDTLRQIQEGLKRLRNDPDVQRRCREVAEADARREANEKQMAIDRVRRHSTIGPLFEDRTFANLVVSKNNEEAVAIAKMIVADPMKRGAVFHGPYGNSKTHIGAAIAHACIARGIPAIMNTLETIFITAGGTQRPGNDLTEERYLRDLSTTKVLILDDLGKERLTEWRMGFFWSFINARYEQKLPIIATSNFTLAELTERYATPIPGVDHHMPLSLLDRMGEMWGDWVEVRGQSHRTRNKNADDGSWPTSR
jgi:DNA replication protein DnaC